jgi:hypothetical protein
VERSTAAGEKVAVKTISLFACVTTNSASLELVDDHHTGPIAEATVRGAKYPDCISDTTNIDA